MSRLIPEVHPVLTEDVVAALQARQVFTVLDFINCDTQQIGKIARLTFREVLAVKNSLLKKFAAPPINGFDCYRSTLRNTAIIPTGIESVDRLLDGGFITGNIYEVCGTAASGKTQFALTVVKNVVQNLKQNIYFLDTKNDFSGRKMKNMIKTSNDKEKADILNRIMVKRTYTKWDLINSLYEIKKDLESDLKLRLIVIDSLPAVLLNSNDHAKNNSFINHLVNVMRYIALEHHIAFLITNLITTWNEGDFKTHQQERISCGKYWRNIPNVRLSIKQLEELNTYTLSLLNSDILSSKTKHDVNIVLSMKGFSKIPK